MSTITVAIIRIGTPIKGTMTSQNGRPRCNKPKNPADYWKQAWPATPKPIGTGELAIVR